MKIGPHTSGSRTSRSPPRRVRRIATAICLAHLGGCASEQNCPTAGCRTMDAGFEISLSGRRFSLPHSLTRAMLEQTYEAREVLRFIDTDDKKLVPLSWNGSYAVGGCAR